MTRVLSFFLSQLVRFGHLGVETCDGFVGTFGDGSGPPLVVKLTDRAAERRLALDPELAFGELFMEGRLDLVEGDLYDLLELGARNLAAYRKPGWIKLLQKGRIAVRRIHQRNDRVRAR